MLMDPDLRSASDKFYIASDTILMQIGIII